MESPGQYIGRASHPILHQENSGIATVDTFRGASAMIDDSAADWFILENVTSLDKVKPEKLILNSCFRMFDLHFCLDRICLGLATK